MMKKLALSLFKSADEKLRGLGHKGHQRTPSSENSNTYCGSQTSREPVTPTSAPLGVAHLQTSNQSRVTPAPSLHSITSARSEPPDVPPPPLPSTSSQNITPGDRRSKSHDQLTQSLTNRDAVAVSGDLEENSEVPPPLYPKPHISLMAERRAQRQNRKSGASLTGNESAKRRSRSEGPHGRRKLRNSMHETSTVSNSKPKQNASNGRYSMYAGHASDNDDTNRRNVQSGSDSEVSDDQRWTKNPLMVRKSKKSDRLSKTDKRRSAHNVDRSDQFTSGQYPNMLFQDPKGKDLYIGERRLDNLGNKAKFLRMEENRKKRIDMAVTSDEECSPQLRISRLRQRAMLSSNLQSEQSGHRDSINIVPQNVDNSQQDFHPNGFSRTNNTSRDIDRVSVYDDDYSRLSKYDENFNIDNASTAAFYPMYPKQQGMKQTKLPNVLPEYLPENRLPVQQNFAGDINDKSRKFVPKTMNEQRVPANSSRMSTEATMPQNRVKLSSEFPKMRSFNEVRANQPTQLKQAVGKVELVPRSPNSSSDSLDDLIESNIQYLESEIESGKLQRCSGNFSHYQPHVQKSGQKTSAKEQVRKTPNANGQDPFRTKLHDPRSYVQSGPSGSVLQSNGSQSFVPHRSENTSIGDNSVSNNAQYLPNYAKNYDQRRQHDSRHGPVSGSATYSPYMQRKQVEPKQDVSKSDTQLNKPVQAQNVPEFYHAERNFTPYPILNRHTGNVMYVQPDDTAGLENLQIPGGEGNFPGVDSGMFSDVEYNIEVSERIKKWEKKLTPGEIEERRKVLNTIKEYESMSDTNTKDGIPDTPVEIRRELRQLMSPTDNTGVGQLSVNLSKSPVSVSDRNVNATQRNAPYFEPKVVSSETNTHRIFRVVSSEPKPQDNVSSTCTYPVYHRPKEEHRVSVQRGRKHPIVHTGHTQSLSNVTLSESEVGTNMQQSWPPMVVDSDSGIRKSWRLSRYEDEINELKEMVSDNVRDIRKKFDSDYSETDTRRASSPVLYPVAVASHPRRASSPVIYPVEVTSQPSVNQKPGTSTLTLNITPVTPTQPRSPVTIRRKLSDQTLYRTPPASPTIVPLTPKADRKLPIYRSVPVLSKSTQSQPIQPQLPPQIQTVTPEPKPSFTATPESKSSSHLAVDANQQTAAEVWSPHMESRKGLVSIERMKARTLQTIPLSEDPVWKEMEGLATFKAPEQGNVAADVNFDEIDELLRIATGGVDKIRSSSGKTVNPSVNNQTTGMMTTEMLTPSTSNMAYADNLMTSSYSPNTQINSRARKLSDSTLNVKPKNTKPSFTPPIIQPLKLGSNSTKKSSTSALDEVLEDIRASLQKKPLSPKLVKNLDSSESNSSANLSLQSPLTKSSKSFVFYPKDRVMPQKDKAPQPPPPPAPKILENLKSSSAATPGNDTNTSNWQQIQHKPANIEPAIDKSITNDTYIDPDFTQYPYIINGNYHLDPNLLSEKLKKTGLVNEHSTEHPFTNKQKPNNQFEMPVTIQSSVDVVTSQSEPAVFQNQFKPVVHTSQSKPPIHELDQSVGDLRALAQEVEHKLSQIKSRIISADEDRLDNILLALRKFAPITEQQLFNVKFTPNYESEKERRSKLEDALHELDRMYESLNLNDESLMDRASRREELLNYQQRRASTSSAASTFTNPPGSSAVSRGNNPPPGDSKILRRSQIDEIERQTQNEFEDITKSFQVLLDEVTKQCQTVAQGSSRYEQNSRFLDPNQFSNAHLAEESGTQKLQRETMSQRDLQDSYNTAIRELESVAMGNIDVHASTIPTQSSSTQHYKEKETGVQAANTSLKPGASNFGTSNLNIQVQSRATSKTNQKPSSPTCSKPFISMATEFNETATSPTMVNPIKTTTLQVELNSAKPKGQTRSARFRKRSNIEHRKSMPAITRTVETQTVETQTETAPSVAEMKEKYEQIRRNSILDMSSDSSPDIKGSRPFQRKMSSGVMKVSHLHDSSDDERKRDSKIRHSLSAPDIVSLLDCLNEESLKMKKAYKQRSTNKWSQSGELMKDSRSAQEVETDRKIAMLESELAMEIPKRKPPVYPVWQYPGQVDLPTCTKQSCAPRKSDFGRDLSKAISDTETEVSRETGASSFGCYFEETVVRRRTRSVGAEDDHEDRPRSFHELVATFEKDPARLERLRQSGLRKCASEDSMFTDLVLQKIYHSESDLHACDSNMKRSASGAWRH